MYRNIARHRYETDDGEEDNPSFVAECKVYKKSPKEIEQMLEEEYGDKLRFAKREALSQASSLAKGFPQKEGRRG